MQSDPRPAPFSPWDSVLGIDVESHSDQDIERCGAWVYAQHPTTDVWVVCFAWAHLTTGQISPVERWHPGQPVPAAVREWIAAGGPLLAHNFSFEASIFAHVLGPRHGWPVPELAQWQDTMALARSHCLPASLEGMAAVLASPIEKDGEGKRLMRRIATQHTCTPADLERLSIYCDHDVLAMLHSRLRMSPLSPQQARLFELDKRINARGAPLDADYARVLRETADARAERLDSAVRALTDMSVHSATSTPALKRWVVAQGVALPMVRRVQGGSSESLDKDAVEKLLDDSHELPPAVVSVLHHRQEHGKITSLAKASRVEEVTTPADRRLRFALQFHAASTGRWSSTMLQLHNMAKDRLDDDASAFTAAVLDNRALDEWDRCDLLSVVGLQVLGSLSAKLRGVVAAPPGREFIGADFSAIEACGCAWLAGQEDKLEFLHTFFAERAAFRRGERPTKPQDLYEYAAESIGSTERQLGKVAELALQYGMGDFKFAVTAAKWGVPLELKKAARTKRAWRNTNKMIVKLWADYEAAAANCIRERSVVQVGPVAFDGRAVGTGASSRMLVWLPSGRALSYWHPKVRRVTKKVRYVNSDDEIVTAEFEGDEIAFRTPVGARMLEETTYGGKLTENVTQAICADLLGDALLRLDAAGYEIDLHVHDSILAEVDAGTRDVGEFCAIMAEVPPWAKGMPIAADGYRARRFKG